MPSFRPPLHPRSTLPPPRRVGLRCPTPVGHGRGLASRPGCAGPGEGVVSPSLRSASPTPGERGRRSYCHPIGSQPLLAIARDSLCLPPAVPYRLRRDRRAAKHFCQYAGPSDNRTVMQSSRTLSTLCVYSPLRFAYGYITRAIVRRASGGGSSRQAYATRSPFPAQVMGVRLRQEFTDA